MGCATSKPATIGEAPAAGPPVDLKAPAADGQSPAKTTRARRLSYSTTGNGMQSAKEEAQKAIQNGAGTSELREKNSNTRVRRLSYVTNGKELDKIKAEYGSDDPTLDDGMLPQMAMAQGNASSQNQGHKSGRPIDVLVACMSRGGREPGYKKTNQDNCFAFEKYISEEQSLFGTMDGHGPHGHLVSGFVKQHLPILLLNHLSTQPNHRQALSTGFLEMDAALANSRIDCEFSGSTCVVAYLKGKTLLTAWVGDSRGVLARQGKKGIEAVDLTVDHKPTAPEEKARIIRTQGRVERLVDESGQPMGPYRVWLQYAWIPGLAMSRALGDQLAHQVGVISEPEHTCVELTPMDKFMVLASDGVWEFITSKEAVEILNKHENVEDGCRALVDEAYQRWLTEEDGVVDDITAVVVKFVHNS